MNGIVAASVAPTVGPLDGVGARVGMSDAVASSALVVRTRSVSRDAAVAPEGTGSQPAVYERWKDARLVPTSDARRIEEGTMRARRIGLATLVALLAVATSISGVPAAAKSAKPAETSVRLTALDGSAQARSRIIDGRTVVSSPRDGSVTVRLDEPLQLRVVESGGTRVALATPLPAGADTYRPGGRASTRLVVADLGTGTSRAFNVPRNVEPEAFGVGPSRDLLFVVDHRPARNPSSYRVGAVNLINGRFQGLFGPSKTPLDIDMTVSYTHLTLPTNREV